MGSVKYAGGTLDQAYAQATEKLHIYVEKDVIFSDRYYENSICKSVSQESTNRFDISSHTLRNACTSGSGVTPTSTIFAKLLTILVHLTKLFSRGHN